jgi:hypothetical protein
MDNAAGLVFSVSSLFILPFWALMLLAPRWRWTARIIGSPAIVVGPVALYTALVLPRLLALLPVVARPELPVIAGLLGTARGATIAWVHFLALDLFAGRYIYLDARPRGLSPWVVTPLLALTLLFAPLGLGAYLIVLALRARADRASADRASAVGAGPRDFARAVSSGHRPLAWLTLGALALLAASLLLGLVDGRQVVGAPVWMKPAKFAASIAVTAPVLAWILGQMRGDRRWRRLRRAGTLISVVAALELVGITVQAARGVPSHFNNATRGDAALFAGMGVAITMLWLAELYVMIRALRYPFATPARAWGIRLGLIGALVGGAVGFVMPRPTAAQLATLHAQRPTPLVGAHAVGVPDGGPGLPVSRWSTEGGDLRAPHFIGLHALQALPLAAWLLERRRRRGAMGAALTAEGASAASARPVVAFGVGWIGLLLVALWQALRSQPLFAPDGLTLAAAAMVIATAVGIAVFDPSAIALGARAREDRG